MFRRFLGLDRRPELDPRLPAGDTAAPLPDSAAETATARRIVARLEALPPEEARYLACFAYVMSRAANADFDISAEETALMEQLAVESGGLDEAQAVLVVEMAKLQARSQGGTEDFVVTREFRSISTPEQRRALVRCCFAVAAADGSIGAEEASVVNEIARELDLEPTEVNALRAAFHDQLSSVQAVRRARPAEGESPAGGG
ncbi:MAG TPA: TerB family tellurite resistance protein [Candidatus Limnocylindrales bacterium]|nr:TerB family tellurite resistance protein [Candidatus Limnocylindrales bacterium]